MNTQKDTDMKKLATLALAGTLLISTSAFAQEFVDGEDSGHAALPSNGELQFTVTGTAPGANGETQLLQSYQGSSLNVGSLKCADHGSILDLGEGYPHFHFSSPEACLRARKLASSVGVETSFILGRVGDHHEVLGVTAKLEAKPSALGANGVLRLFNNINGHDFRVGEIRCSRDGKGNYLAVRDPGLSETGEKFNFESPTKCFIAEAVAGSAVKMTFTVSEGSGDSSRSVVRVAGATE
jgi:hypothetical protein